MKKRVDRKSMCAVIGLTALSLYILACTSFSPDDSKVLYPVWDGHGATGVAVYDRKTRKSELLFQPVTSDLTDSKKGPALLRPQWTEDGHSFLTTWMLGGDETSGQLNLAVLPFDRRGTSRNFFLKGLGKDAVSQYYYRPLPVVGSTVFLTGESNILICLNLKTGEVERKTNIQDLVLLPSLDDKHLLYLKGLSFGPSECGLLDPVTFARTPLFKMTDEKPSPYSMAISRNGKCLAYLNAGGLPPFIHLVEGTNSPVGLSLKSLPEHSEIRLGEFSPDGRILYAALRTPAANGTNVSYGFAEIPVDGSAIRQTILISNAPANSSMLDAFQIGIAHNGKTLAVDSMWLAGEDTPINAEDCALFLVDLSDSHRRVTKILIPVPAKEAAK